MQRLVVELADWASAAPRSCAVGCMPLLGRSPSPVQSGANLPHRQHGITVVQEIEQQQPCRGIPPAGDQRPQRDADDNNKDDEMPRLWVLRGSNHGLSGVPLRSEKGWIHRPQQGTQQSLVPADPEEVINTSP